MITNAYDVRPWTVVAKPIMKGWPFALIALLVIGTLPSCGLIGGGGDEEKKEEEKKEESGEEQTSEVDALNEQLDAAISEVSSLKAQLQEAQAALEAKPASQVEGQVSLEKARLQTVLFARQNTNVYGNYQAVPLVWEVQTAEEQEEFYYIRLTWRPFSGFEGEPGLEEFIVDKAGTIEFRQVLSEPKAGPAVEPAVKPEGGG